MRQNLNNNLNDNETQSQKQISEQMNSEKMYTSGAGAVARTPRVTYIYTYIGV